MSMLWSALAAATALVHLSLIVLLICGGPLAVVRPAWRRVHLVAIAATASVFLAGADCPLTVWEKAFVRRSGAVPYDGGFVEHYLIRPFGGQDITPLMTAMIVAAWLLPSVASYALIAHRRSAGTAAAARAR